MLVTDKRCWAEVSLSVIRNNYRIYKNHLPAETKIMAVVKADAYGHGDVDVASVLQDEGVDDFAVATLEEAIKLRTAGIKGQIFVLGYTPILQAVKLIEYDITQAIVDENHAERLSKIDRNIKVVFALDTGMNRIGLDAEDPTGCAEIIRRYAAAPGLTMTGIFTHLCTADTEDEEAVAFTERQKALFDGVKDAVKDLNLPCCHCLNSAGGRTFPAGEGACVRLGIILYGLKPDYSNVLPEGIMPALSWKSTVAMVKDLHPGETVGYGRTFRAEHPMRIATIPTGYADGYHRSLSNRGYVLIRGMRGGIVGRVCMDQMMVDVTDIPDCAMGDEAVLLGRSGDEFLSADDMAQMIGTIGYELVCDISSRVPRIYKEIHE